jgi:hypothetical protein
MSDVRGKYVAPSVGQTAFSCPHCGALTTQEWFRIHAGPMGKGTMPVIVQMDGPMQHYLSLIKDQLERFQMTQLQARRAKGFPFFRFDPEKISNYLENVFASQCYNCSEIAIWMYRGLLWPRQGTAPMPNPDLSEEVRQDYLEASTILNLSPRGAAALLRLATQKLCVDLGESGKHLDSDIASLVKKGLDVKVQQALDYVRFIGNNAVHPGQIDIKDDSSTAETLFVLVNRIADRMISEPKHTAELYGTLPEDFRKAVEKRDAPPQKK